MTRNVVPRVFDEISQRLGTPMQPVVGRTGDIE